MSPPSREKDDRNARIYWRYMSGDSLTVIAHAFGVSRERASQIVKGQWLRRHRLRRHQERAFLYACGLGMVYLAELQQLRRAKRRYRIRPDSTMHIEVWN